MHHHDSRTRSPYVLKHAMFCTGHMELRNHIMYSTAVAVTCKKDVEMGLCMFNFVFMSSPVPLHTAMPIYTLFEYFLA